MMAKYELTADTREVTVPISVQDLERFTRLEAERGQDFAIIAEMRAAFKEVPDEELDRALAQARKKHSGGQQCPDAKTL